MQAEICVVIFIHKSFAISIQHTLFAAKAGAYIVKLTANGKSAIAKVVVK